jgi:hypothetical protein
MNPRAVRMAKAVTEYDSGSIDTALLGNVLAPQYRGWTNNSANYYTKTGSTLWNPGTPFMAQPCVYGYVEGQNLYRWFPVRPSNVWPQGMGYTIQPVRGIVPSLLSGTPTPPPIDTLASS